MICLNRREFNVKVLLVFGSLSVSLTRLFRAFEQVFSLRGFSRLNMMLSHLRGPSTTNSLIRWTAILPSFLYSSIILNQLPKSTKKSCTHMLQSSAADVKELCNFATHSVWKSPKMSHLDFGIFHQFLSFKMTCLVTLFDRNTKYFW